MKKILFNDKFLLTQAVLDGRKTQTRRICKEQVWAHSDIVNAENGIFHFEIPKYKVGEVVAVAQSYKDLRYQPTDKTPIIRGSKIEFIEFQEHKGWTNKMFVAPNLMPHEIRITNVRIERLQDISDEDCLKEGVVISEPKIKGGARMYYPCEYLKSCANKIGWGRVYHTPREAYAVLIDKVSGKGTWDKNPWVWAYDFELVK